MATNPATVTVTYAGADGQPIPNTALTVTDRRTGYTRTLTSGPDGQVTFARIYAGAYTVSPAQSTLWERAASVPFTVTGGETAGITVKRPFSVLLMPIYRMSSVEY